MASGAADPKIHTHLQHEVVCGACASTSNLKAVPHSGLYISTCPSRVSFWIWGGL